MRDEFTGRFKPSYTLEYLREVVEAHSTRKILREKNQTVYNAAYKQGLLDEVYGVVFRWTPALLKKEASKYLTRKAFEKGNISAYTHAAKNKCLDDVCKHMVPQRRVLNFTTLQKIALKYKSKKEFEIMDKSAWNMVLRKGYINDICAHMVVYCNPSDTIYVWEVLGEKWDDKSMYKIGVTRFSYGEHRLNIVASAHGFTKKLIVFAKVYNPRKIERDILKTYIDKPSLPMLDGHSEFRCLSKDELNAIIKEINNVRK